MLNRPYYDGEAWDLLLNFDSEDCKHIGNGIPCRFYNRLEFNRGENCAYSHNKSVRMDPGLAENAKERSLCDFEQNSNIPKPH